MDTRVLSLILGLVLSANALALEALSFPDDVQKFYERRGGKNAWIVDGVWLPRAKELLGVLHEAKEHGLNPKDYHVETLDTEGILPDDAEKLLTDGFLAYADHLFSGRFDPSAMHIDWQIRRRKLDRLAELEGALKRGGSIPLSLARLAPRDARYTKLKAALKDQEDEDTSKQIAANLERLRWLPRELGERYLFVDIADFSLSAFEDGKKKLSMRIIVGGDFKRTPMFMSRVTQVVVNPYWNIPRSIIREEIIPKAKLNPDFLTKRHIRVYEDFDGARREMDPKLIDWSSVKPNGYPFHFQEHSGRANPLGPLKFNIPSGTGVYLHGTPNHRLFEKETRTLSHGCIRVENPVGLATFLLKRNSRRWSKSELSGIIVEGVERRLSVEDSVPVYLWYRTAWVDENGELQLRPDVYGWDAIVANAIEGKLPVVTKEQQKLIRRQ